ncbi:hypothetical protein M3Y97_00204800 [Aphelenchoides bicaudatus]|nr:hypothetical protein M3Y97_00204800 [Aphelenchoides bicaudatus]
MDQSVLWDLNLNKRVFICRPSLVVIQKIAELIRADPIPAYCVVLVDRLQNFCETELERHGVYGLVTFYELKLYATPLESDLFSLELPQPTCKISHDQIGLTARTLLLIQSLYGLIPVSYGIGEKSQQLETHMKQLFEDEAEPSVTADRPISHLFIFDRQLDLPSVLMTGMTYESMLNDNFQYSCGKIIFGDTVESKLKSQNSKAKTRVFALNNSDAIFSAVRDKHMTSVFPFLSSKAKTLQTTLKKVEEMKNFVSNEFKSLNEDRKNLELHISASEAIMTATKGCNDRVAVEHAIVRNEADPAQIMDFLESLICRQHNVWQILQLVCLWSLTYNGIPSKHYQTFRTLFLHAYGYEHIISLYSLQLHGYLVEQNSSLLNTSINALPNQSPKKRSIISSGFNQLSKTLNLCPKANEKRSDGSYVFSDAYLPVIVSLLDQLVTEGWQPSLIQKAFGAETPHFCSNPAVSKPDKRIRKAILVCFLGGVTHAEIASIHRFAHDNNFRIIILTTHIINREAFIRSFTEII